MAVSTFGWWFIGIAFVFLIGFGFISAVTEGRIKKIEWLFGSRTNKRAPNWMHRVTWWCLVVMLIGLIMVATSFACLFYPGPFCVALYH